MMERVAFILDRSGQRIDCLLNPESLRVRRRAGVARRSADTRPVTGAFLRDEPLLFTGGGVTELDLALLFDVSLMSEARRVDDVRELTGPLWELAENPTPSGPEGPPLVRFVWGKSWNVPGVVVTVTERLERFTSSGSPRRSWLRLRLRRQAPARGGEMDPTERDASQARDASAALEVSRSAEGFPSSSGEAHHVIGDGSRLDEVAASHYGNPALWRLLAEHNGLDDPAAVGAGTVLRVPTLGNGRRAV